MLPEFSRTMRQPEFESTSRTVDGLIQVFLLVIQTHASKPVHQVALGHRSCFFMCIPFATRSRLKKNREPRTWRPNLSMAASGDPKYGMLSRLSRRVTCALMHEERLEYVTHCIWVQRKGSCNPPDLECEKLKLNSWAVAQCFCYSGLESPHACFVNPCTRFKCSQWYLSAIADTLIMSSFTQMAKTNEWRPVIHRRDKQSIQLNCYY